MEKLRLIPFLAMCSVLQASAADLALSAHNPMADIMKIGIENSFESGYGHKNATRFASAYRTSMLSDISENWNMASHLEIPFIYQPGRVPGEKDSFGLGDTTYESFYGRADAKNFFWGIGPAFQIPTATDNQLGTRKWSAGLAATSTLIVGPVAAGVRANHLWSFAGDDDRPDVNATTLEYWLVASLGNGWWIGTSPVNTANWEAPANEALTIPIGGAIGKVVGKKKPFNIKFEVYSLAEAPPEAGDWTITVGIESLFTPFTFLK